MSLYFNPPKEDSKYATVGGIDWENINSIVEFSELRSISDESHYYLYLYATKFTDLVKIGEKDWRFEPQLITLDIAKADVVKSYNAKEKKQVDRAKSDVEKLIGLALADKDPDKAYKGFFSLQSGGHLKITLSGKDTQGKEIPEVVQQQLLSTLFSLEETDTELVPVDDVKVKAKKAWSNGSKGQSEYEKLSDRLKWIADQVKLANPEIEIKTLMDLADQCEANPKIQRLFDWSVSMFH